jgi:hypothetical protein
MQQDIKYYTTCNGVGHGNKFPANAYCGNGQCRHCSNKHAMSIHLVAKGNQFDHDYQHVYVCTTCKERYNYVRVTKTTIVAGKNIAEHLGLHGVLMGF